MKYETVMGLEVHVELSTESKLFCACSAKFGADVNENVCPACSGMPGVPAITNKKAVELGIAAAIVTNSEITREISFDKKNYFYPDLPTGHQITQIFAPICRNGWVEIETDDGKKKITLAQIHIEEDAGKLIHDSRTGTSLVDFNRASVPLIEIVSNPDFRSAKEVVAYLEKLRALLSFADISDCKMQEGSMRCDVNISVRKTGSETLGTRTEIKNMNSLKAIAAAIEYESRRHVEVLEAGEALVQETRRWDDNKAQTFSMREKEDATDYRYFPNPEIMPIVIGDDWIEEIRKNLPEKAEDKFSRLTKELGLSDYDSGIITASKTLSALFDATMKYVNKPKEIANWIIVELLSIAKGNNKGADDVKIDIEKFAKIIELVDNRTVNRNVGKKILALVLSENIDPMKYIEENSLSAVSDTAEITKAVEAVFAENTKQLNDYKNGNEKLFGFFVGQTMKKLGGKADPKVVNEAIKKWLSNI
ncbi:MAG: Asp-tRNA(Asn)/Glu-tRNA(Gln) amidotransferase subunit GatB [Clostridiales bacterium]|jgi:aspartyl-tRNA(Asn)/glutamyl-tRNA(Gln) amidotransferase subunit B|nr:Asp-tRNA(Asn)/Glu-tRNA(Gln) amidotransferase subunit GatB [Clostridiales bacterium]